MDELQAAERGGRAQDLVERLREQEVRAVAITFVDNAGITRVKGVPVARLPHALESGIGMSPVFDVFLVNDDITTSEEIGGPTGDLRLYPDASMLVALAAQPGWAWAPVDRRTQEGEVYPACQRSFARRMVERAAERGLELRMAFELEWMVGSDDETGEFTPASQAPAYGMARIVELSDYTSDVLDALDQQRVRVEQLHPEYAGGQFELSMGAVAPVAAADLNVLVRHTIRAVSIAHGTQASFAPAVVAGSVGNGGHLHFSVWREGQNQFSAGSGRYGMTETGEAFLAGVLESLPALCAIGAPSVSSYLRLVPSHWAGAYQAWGRENRETGIRFITGTVGHRSLAANAEVKCFDLSANPYLAVGALIACGLDGVERGLRLREEITGDPSALDETELARLGVSRLPTSVPEALAHLERSPVLPGALGSALYGAFRAVRQAEQSLFGGRDPVDVAAATRWRY
jgi:glutamine synthetase